MKYYKDQDQLTKAYQTKSVRDIAKECGVSAPTIRYYLKKFGITTRTISEGMLCKSDHISQYSSQYWADENHREQHSAKLKKTQSNRKPELSKAAKKNWKRNRNAIIAGIRRSATSNKKDKISNSAKKSWTQNRRLQQAITTSELWADPEYRTKTLIGIQLNNQSEEFRKKVSAASKKMWENKNYRYKQANALANLEPTSILDKCTIELLENMGIDAAPQSIGPWTFDVGFRYNNRSILIECQGEYWHSKENRKIRDKQKKTYYDNHLKDTYELYYIYEHQFYGLNSLYHIILHILESDPEQIDFNFDDCYISSINPVVANKFFNKYHYLSKGRSGVAIGCMLNKKLIAACIFTSITRKQAANRLKVQPNEIVELHRLCIHPTYHKRNFASWFLAKVIKYIPQNVKLIIAYSDLGAGHEGTVYKAAGWQYDGKTKPSYWYVDSEGRRYYKKSVWDQAKRLGLKERQYAAANGLYRIDGLEVLRFIKKL